jgi:hypothetical protein
MKRIENKILLKILAASLVALLSCHGIALLIHEFEFYNAVGSVIYTVLYFVILISLFCGVLSLLLLVVGVFLRKRSG